MPIVRKTQVGIVGAGPAGLVLALLLHAEGIECHVIEARDRAYIEARVRAGLLEQGTVDVLAELGVDGRLREEGYHHDSFEVRFGGVRYHVPIAELTGGLGTWMYGQQEVVKDLLRALVDRGVPIEFEVSDVEIAGFESDEPEIHYVQGGEWQTLGCQVVVGCDGFHGVTRQVLAPWLTTYSEAYPFGWLGILVDAPPATMEELIYAHHPDGFALHSFRSPQVSRMYLQVPPDDDPEAWADDRIWEELRRRFATEDGWEPIVGPIRQKSITPMRCFVAEPMQRGNLFLAGDAAHIVPPTAAKGLNLAVSDVRLLAEGLVDGLRRGDRRLLDAYSERALADVWDVQAFSWEMTNVFHHLREEPFAAAVQEAQLRRLCTAPAYTRAFSEAYTGFARRARFMTAGQEV